MTKDDIILRKLTAVLLDAECENLMVDKNEDATEQCLEKKKVNKIALHEIKYLMNRVGTYNNFDENELDSTLN